MKFYVSVCSWGLGLQFYSTLKMVKMANKIEHIKPTKSHTKMHFATDTKMPLQVTNKVIKETRKVYKKHVNQTSTPTGSEETELRDLRSGGNYSPRNVLCTPNANDEGRSTTPRVRIRRSLPGGRRYEQRLRQRLTNLSDNGREQKPRQKVRNLGTVGPVSVESALKGKSALTGIKGLTICI